jgi:hypothetical protein
MGMFDELVCDYPLPDGFDASKIVFQTKDLDNLFDVYTIEADGALWLTQKSTWGHDKEDVAEAPEFVPFSGDIIFYSSNLSSSGPEGYTTVGDEPYWSREYQAIFNDGKLLIPIKLLDSRDGSPRWEKPTKHLTRTEFLEIYRKKYGKSILEDLPEKT